RRAIGNSFYNSIPARWRPGMINSPEKAAPLFRTLGAVLRTALLAVLHALRIEHAAQDVVTHTGKIADTAAADQHDAMFLEVVAFAGDVGDDFALVGQADLRNFTECRVRLFRGRRIDASANAALLRVCVH